jgi:hypothetical protein
MPKAIERLRTRWNSARSISRPTKNINSSLPSSAKKSAIGRFVLKKPRTYGPTMTPPSNSPTTSGTCTRRHSRGMLTSIKRVSANLPRADRVRT